MASFGFGEELSVPVEGVAGDEACEEVVGSDGAAGSHEEETECCGEEEVRLAIDPSPGKGLADAC